MLDSDKHLLRFTLYGYTYKVNSPQAESLFKEFEGLIEAYEEDIDNDRDSDADGSVSREIVRSIMDSARKKRLVFSEIKAVEGTLWYIDTHENEDNQEGQEGGEGDHDERGSYEGNEGDHDEHGSYEGNEGNHDERGSYNGEENDEGYNKDKLYKDYFSKEGYKFYLNKGEHIPKFKFKYHWVSKIIGFSKKYEFDRLFVNIVEEKDGITTIHAKLEEGGLYEVNDGYDRYFCQLKDGVVQKISKAEVVQILEQQGKEKEIKKESPKDKSGDGSKKTPTPTSTSAADILEHVEKLKFIAQKFTKQAKEKGEGGVFQQNWTARRGRQIEAIRRNIEKLERAAKMATLFAQHLIEMGSYPFEMMKSMRHGTQIESLMFYVDDYISNKRLPNATTVKDAIKSKSPFLSLFVSRNSPISKQIGEVIIYFAEIYTNSNDTKEDENAKAVAKEIKDIETDFRNCKEPNFFPTPKSVIDIMLLGLELNGKKVLEPSAGLGDIAVAIRDKYSDVEIDVCERYAKLQRLLELKNFNVVGSDTLTLKGKYDAIVMNPPFSPPGISGEHVQYCFNELLKDGGDIVALVDTGLLHRSSKKDEQFRNWFEENDGVAQKLPEGSFNGKDAFCRTGVSVTMLIMRKKKREKTLIEKRIERIEFLLSFGSDNITEKRLARLKSLSSVLGN